MNYVKSHMYLFCYLAVSLIIFFGLYEIYVRPGWVDGSMYIGYALNSDIYRIFAFEPHNYQGSRLGYILPLKFLFSIAGGVNGRLLYVVILYLAYVLSVSVLTRTFIKTSVERVLISVLLILNPVFISSICYGGADGPAAVQLLVAISLLVCASRDTLPLRRDILSFISGIFIGLSISSHVFAFIPLFLTIPTLICAFKQPKLVIRMFLGGLAAVFMLDFLGRRLGLEQLYLLYNIPWARISIGGAGAKFAEPFAHWIKNAMLWTPIIYSIPLFFFINRNITFREVQRRPLMFVSLLNLTGPIIIYTLYDVLTKSNTIVTPAYFNIIYPSFVVGLVTMFPFNTETTENENPTRCCASQNRSRIALISLVFISLYITFTVGYVKSVLSYYSVKSGDLYRSQIRFMERIKSSELATRQFKFIYTVVGSDRENDPRVYKDNYKQNRRYNDYLDSLTSLFLWDRSIALRLGDPDINFKQFNFEQQKDIPIIFLGRSKSEVQQLVIQQSRFLSSYTAGSYQSFSDSNYPWYFIVYKPSNEGPISPLNRSLNDLKILNWGPRQTIQGVVPLVEPKTIQRVAPHVPNGIGVIWIQVYGERGLGTLKVQFNGKSVPTIVSPGQITAFIFADRFNVPGEKQISIEKVSTGQQLSVGMFSVVPQSKIDPGKETKL